MAKIQCVLSHYCTLFHETIYKGTNTCALQYFTFGQSPPLKGVGRPVKLGTPKGNFHIWLKFGVRVQIFLKVEDFDIIFIVKNVICYK